MGLCPLGPHPEVAPEALSEAWPLAVVLSSLVAATHWARGVAEGGAAQILIAALGAVGGHEDEGEALQRLRRPHERSATQWSHCHTMYHACSLLFYYIHMSNATPRSQSKDVLFIRLPRRSADLLFHEGPSTCLEISRCSDNQVGNREMFLSSLSSISQFANAMRAP
jgi:hypothetical protein